MRFLTLAITTLGCLLLSSCFDIREEIWIHADGSGRGEFDYSIPASALALVGGEQGLRTKVLSIIESEPDIQLDEFRLTTSGDDVIIKLKVSVGSMLSLIDLQNSAAVKNLPDSASGFIGSFEVGIKGLSVDFRRHVDLKNSLGIGALAISSNQRKARRLNYTIHLPNVATRHNATKTADQGRTLIWEHSLGEALSSPLDTDFQMRIPIPWWAYALFALCAALFAWVLSRVWRRRFRPKS
ncbi:hypothetical protein [Haloferula sp.]|uniref:hypothetical protein n=1 Tax=Haloferula sp. TaxID=2497595 RepID=UPI003C716E93